MHAGGRPGYKHKVSTINLYLMYVLDLKKLVLFEQQKFIFQGQ